MKRFVGKTALVTGGGRGIGAGIARHFANKGAEVLICGRTSAPLEKTAGAIEASGGKAAFEICDVAHPDQIDALVRSAEDRWGQIDVLVNNAAIFDEAHFLEIERENWDKVIAINLTGPFHMTQKVGRVMAEREGGSIVNVSSVDAHASEPLYASYNTAKAGLVGLTRSAAIELAKFRIRVNAVSPGYVHTEMAEEAAMDPEAIDYMLNRWDRIPMRRMVSIEEVASLCLYLASSEASAITGADFVIDGGMTSHLYALESVPASGFSER